jgi:hypothetical protein
MLAAVLLLTGPFITSAHFGGMPIFKINGEFTESDVFDNTLPHTELRDRAPQDSYPIGSTLQFEIDPTHIPASDVKKTDFIWDFGDGSEKVEGKYLLAQSHFYPNEGVFILTVSIDTTDAGFPMESQVIQVVPIVVGNPVLSKNEQINYLVTPAEGEETPSIFLWNIAGAAILLGVGFAIINYKLKKD